MAGKSRVLFHDDRIKIVRKGSNGLKDPAHIVISMNRPEADDARWHRSLRLDLDELFDLTEVLDDICDQIEDEEEGAA